MLQVHSISLQDLDFYPTPEHLIKKMWNKVKRQPEYVLEPSAGKGDIAEFLERINSYDHLCMKIAVIEKDENLNALLRGKGFKVLDHDFLSFSGPDKFDLIIGNPPFSEGEKHLLKAISIMYSGEIVFLLNAETIRNPYTKLRKVLAQKLKELNAEIEFQQAAFRDAERKTDVEVALVYINIERNVEEDLFRDMQTAEDVEVPEIEDENAISVRSIEGLVTEYNMTVDACIATIVDFYKRYKAIDGYIALSREPGHYSPCDDLTSEMKQEVNNVVARIRKKFWDRTLELDPVRKRMTRKQLDAFYLATQRYRNLDFTENNIRTFILNLIEGFEDALTEAVLEIFDRFTIRHAYTNGLYEKNIHYFNGWKTNNAFKVGPKVVIPIYGYSGSDAFYDETLKEWRLDFGAASDLRDIDLVMNYFDGSSHYVSIANAVEFALRQGRTQKILSTYFEIDVFKKGTIHLRFRDKDVLRRFNVAACRGKSWLPHDYGRKAYSDLTSEEKMLVDSFEGKKSYQQNFRQPIFAYEAKHPLALPE